jgi:hypothetical protein
LKITFCNFFYEYAFEPENNADISHLKMPIFCPDRAHEILYAYEQLNNIIILRKGNKWVNLFLTYLFYIVTYCCQECLINYHY